MVCFLQRDRETPHVSVFCVVYIRRIKTETRIVGVSRQKTREEEEEEEEEEGEKLCRAVFLRNNDRRRRIVRRGRSGRHGLERIARGIYVRVPVWGHLSNHVRRAQRRRGNREMPVVFARFDGDLRPGRATFGLSLIHISEPTRPERISYAVFCLKKKTKKKRTGKEIFFF